MDGEGDSRPATRPGPGPQCWVSRASPRETERSRGSETDYVELHGRPTTVEDLEGHDIIGEDRGSQVDAALATLGWIPNPEDFSLRTDNYLAHLSAIREGLGIGGAQVGLLDDDPRVERVLPDLSLGKLPFYVAMHGEVRASATIRVVYDALVTFLRERHENTP